MRSTDLIDADAGVISRRLFVDREVYERELETLFTRAWLFIGHESQIPNPGDFITSRMGEESVILVRDEVEEVHVFLNSCRHRGMKVCRYEAGNTDLFRCSYHAWAYGLDGALRGVPHEKTIYEGGLDRSAWSLIKVAQIARYKGTVWATWDADAPDFLTYLGDARMHLDLALDCRDGRPGGSEVIGIHKWLVPANWKLAAENFLGDTYHNPSHRSVDLIGIGPSAQSGVKGRRDNELEQAQHVWVSFPAGHGVHSAVKPTPNDYVESFKDHPEIEAYFRDCHASRCAQLGDQSRLLPFVGTMFPNTSYHGGQPRGLCSWHPHSETQTEAWRFFLVDADAPQSVKQFLRNYYMRYSGPAGMTEQDDMENWLYATQASKGAIARRYDFNYQQSLGRTVLDPVVDGIAVPGEVATQISEHMARGFYRRWGSYIDGKSWESLLGHDDPRFQASAAAQR
jgi:phenylpropionate dioxygenase-like ring-hydroxylating dioxygenase large terminal subunit